MKHVAIRGQNQIYYIFPQLQNTISEEDMQAGKTFTGFRYPDGKRYFIRHLRMKGNNPDIHTLLMFQESLIKGDNVHFAGSVEVVQNNGHIFLVRDFIEGKTLHTILRQHSFRSGKKRNQVLRYFLKILESAETMHKAGIIHSNLRPSCIYTGYYRKKLQIEKQQAIIADFSMARTDQITSPDHFKMPNTYIYNAPEVLLSQHDLIGPHSDIYSLGIMLYEMLKGHHPFRVKHPKVVGDMHLSTPITDFRGIDSEIRKIILKATSRILFTRSPGKLEPGMVRALLTEGIKNRYASVLDMADDLRNVLYKTGIHRKTYSKSNSPAVDKPIQHPVVVFDDLCVLCTNSVKYLIRNDKKQILRYSGLSKTTKNVQSQQKKQSGNESILLTDNGKIYSESDAFIRIMYYLGRHHYLFTILKILPRAIRNLGYRFIAGRRNKWWGKRNECYVPPLYERFLFTDNAEDNQSSGD